VSRSVRFADERNGWVFGIGMWATHDGGSTWRPVDSPHGYVRSLEAGDGRVWAVVQSTEFHMFTAPVATDDWQPAGSDPVPTAHVEDRLGELSGTDIVLQGATGYIAGADGVVRALSATGLELRGAPCGNRGGPLSVTGTQVFALCAIAPAAGSSTKTLMLSTDGARTWSPVGSPPPGGIAIGVAAASPSTIVVAASGDASPLYLSQDGGRTWTTVYEGASLDGFGFHDLRFATVSRGVTVAYSLSDVPNRLLVTSDGGRTWSPVKFGP
jgi:photosystem II stability/assembly factor-like uncharacterized protein